MRKTGILTRTSITSYNVQQADPIEIRIRKRLDANEDVEGNDGRAPLRYDTADAGTPAETDIRTDRFEVALDAMSANGARKDQAKRAEMKVVKNDDDKGQNDGDSEK